MSVVPIYSIRSGIYTGPVDTFMRVIENAFSIADIIHSDIKRLIPVSMDLSQKLTHFHYNDDYQPFYNFYTEDRHSVLQIYPNSNMWEILDVSSEDGTKSLQIDLLSNTYSLFYNEIGLGSGENLNNRQNIHTAFIGLSKSSTSVKLDTKWLDNISLMIDN